MEPLKLKWENKSKGMNFFQHKIEPGVAYIYEVITEDGDGEPMILSYEVFKHTERPEMTLKDPKTGNSQTIPPGVSYPGDKAFGSWAWSYSPSCYDKAILKFNELIEKFGKAKES